MPDQVRFLEGGTVTSPKKILAGATFAGIKTYTKDKLDLGILLSQEPCSAAGTFTTNRIKSPSVVLTQRQLQEGNLRALVVNSGIANACVGEQGLWDAQETVALAAQHLGIQPGEVAICSTGIIGVELPMALIRSAMKKIEVSPQGGHDFARAIITTDSHTKEGAVAFQVDGKTITIGGTLKGAGMIHPNMATMLCFLTTDAAVEREPLQQWLKEAVDSSFNVITVDGDTSTNDTVLLFANGASGVSPLPPGSKGASLFQQALLQLCIYLAKELVRGAEGAQKLVEVRVSGSLTLEDARKAARTVAGSSLVKTAVHGNDPNWGRIMAALGRSGAEIVEEKIALYINDVCIMEEGRPIPFFKDAIIAAMNNPEVSLGIHLNLGDMSATAWGCDLTEEYVTFNSAYTT